MKQIFSLLLLLLSAIVSQAQTLDEFFIDGLKNQIQIGRETRSTLINQYKSGKGGEMTLRNGNTIRLLEYKENNYLKVQTSEHGFFMLKRWSHSNRTIFGLSWWVTSTVSDGHIKFVEPAALEQKVIFPEISAKDFLNNDSLKAYQTSDEEITQHLEAEFIHYEFTEENTILVYDNTLEFLDEVRRQKYSKFWKGTVLPVLYKYGTFKIGSPTGLSQTKP